MSEPVEHQYFRMQASPVFWRMKADELKHAADLLWPECERQLEAYASPVKQERDGSILHTPCMTFPIHAALAGFSIECLLKGWIIKADQTLISNGVLAKKLQTHDLLKLAKLAKVGLSQHEVIFCEQVRDDMDVGFRYPIAKSHSLHRESMQLGGKWPDVFHGLFARLRPGLNVLVQGRGKHAIIPD